jgi:23S rRNA G2069 N7-methylase RlmK/C1962 C5-methylase RlmI
MTEEQGESMIVGEGCARLEVTLSQYLDTGLFLRSSPSTQNAW